MSKSRALVVQKAQEPSIALILQEVVNRGITNDNIGTVEKMVALYERMQDRKSEEVFANAFSRLSKAIPAIKATKPVPGRDGTTRFKYEPLHKIEKKLRPLALKHGFTYTFSETPTENGRVTKVCTVQHVGGHKRSNTFTIRSSTPPHATESQGSMADHTYAKRGALCDAFGIVVEHDDDAKMEGKPITADQAAEIRQMVRESKSDEAKFLKWCGAERYEDILDSKLDFIYATLEKKLRGIKTRSDETRDPLTGEFNW